MCKVLIIDDEEYLGLLYQKELSDYGHEVRIVKTMKQAYNFLEGSPEVEMVVLDLLLRGDESLSKLEILRKKFPRIIIVINTAHASYKQNFMTWLADAFLIKSPDLTEFNMTINELLVKSKSVENQMTNNC